MVPLINGRAYDFAQINALINGVVVPSISSIEYSEDQKKENNYGSGDRPVSRGHGAIEAKAKLTMSMNDVEALRKSVIALGGSLLKIPAFDIVVVYLHPTGANVVTHTLKNCEFLSDGVSGSQGDTDLKRDFDLVCSHITYL